MTGTITIRHPYKGEILPEMNSGFEMLSPDPDWQWLAEHEGKVVGQLIGVNAHGLFLMLRMVVLDSAPNITTRMLLHAALEESHDKGCLGYTTFLTDGAPQEVKLMRIVLRSGGYLMPNSGAWAVGRMEG